MKENYTQQEVAELLQQSIKATRNGLLIILCIILVIGFIAFRIARKK